MYILYIHVVRLIYNTLPILSKTLRGGSYTE